VAGFSPSIRFISPTHGDLAAVCATKDTRRQAASPCRWSPWRLRRAYLLNTLGEFGVVWFLSVSGTQRLHVYSFLTIMYKAMMNYLGFKWLLIPKLFKYKVVHLVTIYNLK
jgi:hypothetical protein